MSKLIQLKHRIQELDLLARDILGLSKKLLDLEDIALIQPELSQKGQQWYRGARELMVQNEFSGTEEFDRCYDGLLPKDPRSPIQQRAFEYIEHFIQYGTNSYRYKADWETRPIEHREEYYGLFLKFFHKAHALLLSLSEELLSRELPIVTQLSYELVSEEFSIAELLLKGNRDSEPLIRAAGTIGRVGLERFLHTVIENRKITVLMNPPNKKKAESSDLIETLSKNSIITAIQKSKLEHLFRIGNNCAHPKEVVKFADVEEILKDVQNITSVIQ